MRKHFICISVRYYGMLLINTVLVEESEDIVITEDCLICIRKIRR
jgi:hypothetical protein